MIKSSLCFAFATEILDLHMLNVFKNAALKCYLCIIITGGSSMQKKGYISMLIKKNVCLCACLCAKARKKYLP